MARKLWMPLALGALTYRIEHHRLAIEELQAAGEVTGALPGALASIEVEAHAAERRRTILRDLLPDDTPEHWVAVGGTAIFDEYERKVREIGRRLNPSVRDTDIQPLRRQVEAICVAGSSSFNPEDPPPFTRDRKDDPIVYTALLSRADYLISDITTSCPTAASTSTNTARTTSSPSRSTASSRPTSSPSIWTGAPSTAGGCGTRSTILPAGRRDSRGQDGFSRAAFGPRLDRGRLLGMGGTSKQGTSLAACFDGYFNTGFRVEDGDRAAEVTSSSLASDEIELIQSDRLVTMHHKPTDRPRTPRPRLHPRPAGFGRRPRVGDILVGGGRDPSDGISLVMGPF
jgi:hypothetical protein